MRTLFLAYHLSIERNNQKISYSDEKKLHLTIKKYFKILKSLAE